MKSFTLLLVATALLTTVGCGKKEAAPVVEPTSTVAPFAPAGSGQVTALQAKFWLKANTPLDSLATAHAEALNTKDSVEYHTAYTTYTSERQVTCKNSGLSGGYTEYVWISKNISKAVNRPLLDSLNLQTL